MPRMSPYNGQEKKTSRHFIERRVSPTDRMVNEQNSCGQDFSSLGLSNEESVCDFLEQEHCFVRRWLIRRLLQ